MASPERYALDSSVVVRLLTREPLEQAELALRRLHEEAPCLVSVAEAYFALCFHYKVEKPAALQALHSLLGSPFIEANGVAVQVIADSLAGPSKPGFVDRLIHSQYLPARLLTFELASRKLPGAVVLSSSTDRPGR